MVDVDVDVDDDDDVQEWNEEGRRISKSLTIFSFYSVVQKPSPLFCFG